MPKKGTKKTRHIRHSKKGKIFLAGSITSKKGKIHSTRLVKKLVKQFKIEAFKTKPQGLLEITKKLMKIKGLN
jgi:hypothetical protein